VRHQIEALSPGGQGGSSGELDAERHPLQGILGRIVPVEVEAVLSFARLDQQVDPVIGPLGEGGELGNPEKRLEVGAIVRTDLRRRRDVVRLDALDTPLVDLKLAQRAARGVVALEDVTIEVGRPELAAPVPEQRRARLSVRVFASRCAGQGSVTSSDHRSPENSRTAGAQDGLSSPGWRTTIPLTGAGRGRTLTTGVVRRYPTPQGRQLSGGKLFS